MRRWSLLEYHKIPSPFNATRMAPRSVGKTLISDFKEDCRKVADSVVKDYPGVEADTIFADLFGLFRENEVNLSTLLRAAHILCGERRAVQLDISVQYDYRPSDVARILETVFEMEGDHYVPDDARSLDDHDPIEIATDVKWVLEGLGKSDQLLIEAKYKYGGLEEPIYRAALDRAVERLTERLNSYSRGNRRGDV